jgi:hypothetical protein
LPVAPVQRLAVAQSVGMVWLGRIAGLLLVAVLSAGALLFLLPGLKEGFDASDLPMLGTGAAGLLVAAAVWLRLSGGAIRVLGMLVLAGPLCAYLFVPAKLLLNVWKGRHLAARTRITEFRATPIEWPGFDGPIGLRLEVGVDRPDGLAGNLFPPKIGAGGAPLTGEGYFRYYQPHLGEPPFPPRAAPYTFPPRLVYDLYPSSVQRVDAPRMLCLASGDRRAIESRGLLSASWLFAGRSGVRVDLSPHLTAELSRHAGQIPDAAALGAMFRRTEPAALAGAGYRACAPPAPAMGEACYCRQ